MKTRTTTGEVPGGFAFPIEAARHSSLAAFIACAAFALLATDARLIKCFRSRTQKALRPPRFASKKE